MVAAAPENVPAYVNLALGEHRRADYAQSLATAQQCLALRADEVKCLLVAADDLARMGQPDQARSYVERAKSMMK